MLTLFESFLWKDVPVSVNDQCPLLAVRSAYVLLAPQLLPTIISLMRKPFVTLGLPETITSDSATKFISEEFGTLPKEKGTSEPSVSSGN